MQIPDDVYDRAYDAGEFNMADYKVIAEWARKQALLDAHALCTTTADAAAISRLIEAERQEGNA